MSIWQLLPRYRGLHRHSYRSGLETHSPRIKHGSLKQWSISGGVPIFEYRIHIEKKYALKLKPTRSKTIAKTRLEAQISRRLWCTVKWKALLLDENSNYKKFQRWQVCLRIFLYSCWASLRSDQREENQTKASNVNSYYIQYIRQTNPEFNNHS